MFGKLSFFLQLPSCQISIISVFLVLPSTFALVSGVNGKKNVLRHDSPPQLPAAQR